MGKAKLGLASVFAGLALLVLAATPAAADPPGFNRGVTTGETSTTQTLVAGVQTLPTVGAGSQSAPNMVVGGLQTLPSTSTQDDDPNAIVMLGAALIALGGFLLVRTRRITT